MKTSFLFLLTSLFVVAQNPIERQIQCADAGASDTYACSATVAPAAYVTGQHYRFMANTANTGAATVNFNSLGAKTIKKVAGGITTDLADNDIRVGQWVDLVYDGTNMQMQSLLGNAPAAGSGPQLTTIDNSSGWSDYGTALTINIVSGGGIWTQITSGDEVRARTRATGASIFDHYYDIMPMSMTGTLAESGVMVGDSGTKAVVCGLRYDTGNQLIYVYGAEYSNSTTVVSGVGIDTLWADGTANTIFRDMAGSGWTAQKPLRFNIYSADGTTTRCRVSFDAVMNGNTNARWFPVFDSTASTYLTPSKSGYYLHLHGSGTRSRLAVLGVQ